MTPDPISALRALLQPDAQGKRRLLNIPGCWDGLTALLVEQAAFEAAFLTGGGLSMARLGRPDIGLTTASETIDAVMQIRDRVALPLIVDGDTGFGNAINLQRTVRGFERAGASAIQIEDQSFPKRCGHMAGKTVVPLPEAVGRVKAALDARRDMLVFARTDAVAIEGLEGALERAEAFLDAGADAVFVEGPRTEAELACIATRLARRVPLIHNLVEGGISPTDDGVELERLGFAIALHPLLLMHGFVRQAPGWLAELRKMRTTASICHELVDLKHMNGLAGADALFELGERYDA